MKLEEIIATKIPAAMLERIVFDQNVIGSAQRQALFKPSGLSALDVAHSAVEAYADRAPRLAYGLYEQISDTDWQTAELLFEHFKSTDAAYYNHQASLVGRIPTLPLDELNDFLTSVRGQVCLIVSGKDTGKIVRGTGFLVGEDLVLTCRHVLNYLSDDADLASEENRIEIYFDFYRGEPVESLNPDLPQARRVRLASAWRVTSCNAADPDGIVGDLSQIEAARIGHSLDFILLRLEEKVGLQPMERGGGRQRLWVDLTTAALPKAVEGEDWIIIPQHPNGMPQRIDMGRFRVSDPTNTRLRYDTNTAPGSSGAPCFNQKFRLVGVHNAYVGPPEKPIANQAIRATCIAAMVQEHLKVPSPAAGYVPRWSIARDHEPPRVILGREKLLNWLQTSATAKPQSLADRAYVAQSDVPAAGSSFTTDILHAEIRDTKTPRAVYGSRGQQLPATAQDFLLSLARELGIPLQEADIPARPKAPSACPTPVGASEADKLELWISQELPEWFGGVINSHVEKQIDARPAASQAVRTLEEQGIDVPPTLKAIASSGDYVWVRPNAWEFAYVVLDELRSLNYSAAAPRTEFKGEVRDLIAALVRGKGGETTIHAGLRRLRWMFLGYVPDFLPVSGPDGAIIEALDPAAVGMPEILAVFARMSQAHIRMKDDTPASRRVLAKGVLRSAEKDDTPRLVSLQKETSNSAADFLYEIEG